MQEGLRATGDTEVLKKIVSPRPTISERRQCELLGLNRSMLYYKPVEENPANLELMHMMDEEFLEYPTKGVLGMVDYLRTLSILIGPKRVRRLLRGLEVTHSNHVWCIDITYIPMKKRFLYLTAIIDVHSRYIVLGHLQLVGC